MGIGSHSADQKLSQYSMYKLVWVEIRIETLNIYTQLLQYLQEI